MSENFCYAHPHPAVATDVVMFTVRDERLELLLIKRANDPFRGIWALPGGFLDIDEDLEACARRELEEETGLSGLYMEQLYTFSDPGRDPRERVISVTYLSLVSSNRLELRAASDAADAAWFPIDQLPELAFDHGRIVALAHERLLAKLEYSTIAFQLMPYTFTLSELQSVYEILRGERLDKRNFRKWIQALDLIEQTGELRRSGQHRPARVYRAKNRGEGEIQIIK